MKITKLHVFLMALLVWAVAASAAAQTPPALTEADKARLSRELSRSMAREAPLTEDDYRLYLANLEKIFALRQAPEEALAAAAGISGWSESRFAYVTTKMAVGMSMVLKPDDPRNLEIPDFARPTEREMALIRLHRDELVKSMEALQASRGD